MRVKILGISFGISILICLAGGLSCLNLQEETQEEIQNVPSIWNETQGLNTSEETQKEELMLSNFPDVFKNDTIIVIGENASLIENECAEAITENLNKRTWNIPRVKSDAELTEDDKAKYDLILVGGPRTNSIVQELYVINKNIQAKITNDWPGSNKGVVEILISPWNAEKCLLVVAGWDEYGTNAAANKLVQSHTLNNRTIIVEYEIPSDLLPSPDLVTPPNTTTTDNPMITFGWYNVKDAQKYLLQVDNNSNFRSPEIETYTNESQFTPRTPLSGDTYYWRVKMIDKTNNESDWSDIWRITIFSDYINPKN
jgi:hypothetical protein